MPSTGTPESKISCGARAEPFSCTEATVGVDSRAGCAAVMEREVNDGGRARNPQRGVYQPSLRANGSRERAPDDRLREAIHAFLRRGMDCFVARAPGNDGG